MITFIKGNLFDSPAQVLTNTVNTVGIMGKGIALEFKNRYPDMFRDYVSKCKAGIVEIGKPYLWENDQVQILNFPTKKHWRQNSQLEFVESGLKYLAENYQSMGIYTLALAPLGCGNGGLKWLDVKALMIQYLSDLPGLEVFAYTPPSEMPSTDLGQSDNHFEFPARTTGIASRPLSEA